MNTLAMASLLSNDFEILCIAGPPLTHEHTADHLLEIYKGFSVQIIQEFKREVFLSGDYLAYKKFKSVILNFRPDIVHTHGSKPGILGRWAAHRLNVPLIIHTYHGHVFHGYFSRFISRFIVYLERFMAGKTDMIVAINKQIEHDLVSRYQIASKEKIKLIPLGLDLRLYQTEAISSSRSEIRKELGLSENDFVIAAIGRLVPVKQHSLFIQIAIQLLRDCPEIPFKFLIVGDGSERDHLIEQIKAAGFTCNVGHIQKADAPFTLLLWRKDIPEILSAVDILLHTSVNEGTPVSILEAMAMGKPVVAIPVGGIPELFQSAGAGFVSFDKTMLIRNVFTLYKDQHLRNESGEKGKKYIREKMTIAAQTNTFRQLIGEKLTV